VEEMNMKFFCCGTKSEQYRLPIINARISLKRINDVFRVKFSLASEGGYRFDLDGALVQKFKEILKDLNTDLASRQPLFTFLNEYGHHELVQRLTLEYLPQHLCIDKRSTLAYHDSPVQFSSAESKAEEEVNKVLSVKEIKLEDAAGFSESQRLGSS
jgi:hypothetical protein